MDITDIIGEGKIFEPPFRAEYNPLCHEVFVYDATGKLLLLSSDLRQLDDDAQHMLCYHICNLLNKKHLP